MGLAVRRTRPQSRITAAPVQDPNYSGPKSRNSGCSAVQLRAQSPAVGNGIFGCRDRAPKIITKKGERLQRPKSAKQVAGNPRRSALASTGERAVCGDWMVVCAGWCEPVSTRKYPAIRENKR